MESLAYLTKLKAELEDRLGCAIDIIEDHNSKYPSKIEYARNYARQHHVLRVNPARCKNAYPIFSVPLDTKLQLRDTPDGSIGILQPVSSQKETDCFNEDFRADPKGKKIISSLGYSADSMVSSLRASLIAQSCNQVLEMLAADVVLREYPDAVEDMKQYLSGEAVEGAAVGYEQLLEIYPAFLVNTNRILNLMFSMKCGEVCGKRLIDAYKPTPDELDKALDLFNFYRAERDMLIEKGRIVGDMLGSILRKIHVDRYVHLVVREIAPIIPNEQVNDADDGLTETQRALLQKFYETHGDGKSDSDLMVLGMFKVLRELEKMPLEVVRELAIEIAMLGVNGISPEKKYNLKSLPNRHDIYGHEILAYYYVSWMKVFPDKIDLIGLPYKQAYESAVAKLKTTSGQ